jgi:Spy/CpxP family protein refolding chaperone
VAAEKTRNQKEMMIMISIRSRLSVPVLATCLAALAACAESTPAPAPPPVTSAVPPPPPPVMSAPAAPPPAAASAAPVPAAPPNPTGAELSEGDEHRNQHHAGVMGLVMMSLKDLDLTADQQAAVEKIKTDLQTKMEPARAAGKDFAGALADGVAAGKIDRAKVDAAAAKVVAQAQAANDASLAALTQLHAALTPPQRAKLVDELQAHWEKWKEAHGKDEADDPQHRSGHLLAMVRELNLSQDQAQKIKASFHDKMKAAPQDHAHKEVQDHLQAFATAFKADTFDAKKLAGAKAATGHMARFGTTRIERFVEAATPVLNPDQRTKLAQLLREHAGA